MAGYPASSNHQYYNKGPPPVTTWQKNEDANPVQPYAGPSPSQKQGGNSISGSGNSVNSNVGISVPLHRYCKTENWDHFYTTFWTEGFHQKLIDQWNYAYEGVIGLIYKNPVTGTVPFHRYYNGADGDHLYTTDWDELGGGRVGFKYEGIEGYVYQNPTDGTIPLFRYYNPTVKDHFYTTNWKEMKDEGKGYKLDFVQAYIFPN